ncbi:hypothetical protein EZS27_012785 [termite gut metagenome]|uniref:Uncharacterized protein n=1 Tax=termite gut metagenome TaxID=433724 RepID=A0A5J4RZD8_9ZZZZ
MRYIHIAEEEKNHLENSYKTSLNSVVQRRCFCLLDSNDRHSIKEVSMITKFSRRSIEY